MIVQKQINRYFKEVTIKMPNCILGIFITFIFFYSCKSEKEGYTQKPVTSILVKEKSNTFAQNQNRTNDVVLKNVDEKESAIKNLLSYYTNAFRGKYFCKKDESYLIMLSKPNEKGEGYGLIHDESGYFSANYDFCYYINLGDINDGKIKCELEEYGKCFYIELKGKNIKIMLREKDDILYGDDNPSLYNAFLERIAKKCKED